MNPKEQLNILISEIGEKLKEISDNVNRSREKDPISQISILVNVSEELDDVLLNWEESIIPNKLIQFFKDQDDFDDDDD